MNVQTGETVLLAFAMPDGDTGKYPRALVYDAAGSLTETVDLAHVASGLYQGTYTAPASPGAFSALFTAFDDAGHTTPTAGAERLAKTILVARNPWAEPKASYAGAGTFGEAVIAAAGHAGLHAVLDTLAFDANNNPTAARLRIFPDKATADAATLGAAADADGELLRLHLDAATYVDGSLDITPQVVASLRRTSA